EVLPLVCLAMRAVDIFDDLFPAAHSILSDVSPTPLDQLPILSVSFAIPSLAPSVRFFLHSISFLCHFLFVSIHLLFPSIPLLSSFAFLSLPPVFEFVRFVVLAKPTTPNFFW